MNISEMRRLRVSDVMISKIRGCMQKNVRMRARERELETERTPKSSAVHSSMLAAAGI